MFADNELDRATKAARAGDMILTTAAINSLSSGPDNETTTMRSRSEKLQNYYVGRQVDYLNTVYAGLFTNWADINTQIPLRTANVTAKFVRTLAQAYKRPPERRIVDVNGEPIAKPEAYTKYIDRTHKAIVMKEAERMSILHKACLIKPEWSEKYQCIRYRILLPYMCDVITDADNAQELEAVVYRVKRPADYFGVSGAGLEDSLIYWDDEHTYEIFGSGDIVRPNGLGRIAPDELAYQPDVRNELLNPYGLLPFVAFRESFEVSDQFWPYIDDTWLSINEAVNQVLTDLQMAENFQTFSQWWTKGGGAGYNTSNGESTQATLNLSRLSMVELGPDGELGSTSPESHIEEINSVLELILKIASWVNDTGEFSLSSSKQVKSGIAYMMEKYDTMENVENRKDFYRQAEQDLFAVEKAIIDYHVGGGIPDDTRLEVVYAAPGGILSTEERVAQETFDITMNVTTAAELLMKRRPDIKDIATAQAEVEKNQTENAKNLSKFSSTPTVTTDQLASFTGQTEDAENE